jgi:photosystem II stability/assembly factor-like uncharacterized protein
MRARGFLPYLFAAVFVAVGARAETPQDDGAARPMPLAAQGMLLDAVAAGPRLVAVGQHGDVVLSDDQGKRWRQAKSVPTRTTLTAVAFVDGQHGFTVGHGGQILASEDGGERWKVVAGKLDGRDSLFAIWFKDAKRGYAVGPYGYALATSDGGASWNPLTISEGEDGEKHLNAVFGDGGGRIYLAAEGGMVFTSDDEGQSWQAQKTPYQGSLWGGLVRRDGSVVVWGMAGHALVSKDRGASWTELKTNTTQSLTAGVELGDGTLVFVGLSGAVSYGTPDSGFKSFTRENRMSATAVLSLEGALLLFGQDGATRIDWPPR